MSDPHFEPKIEALEVLISTQGTGRKKSEDQNVIPVIKVDSDFDFGPGQLDSKIGNVLWSKTCPRVHTPSDAGEARIFGTELDADVSRREICSEASSEQTALLGGLRLIIEKLRTLLDSNADDCIAATQKSLRCRNRLSGYKRAKIPILVEDLETFKSPQDLPVALEKLQALSDSALCHRHQVPDAINIVVAWNSMLTNSASSPKQGDVCTIVCRALDIGKQLHAVSYPGFSDGRNASIRKFVGYETIHKRKTSVATALYNTMTKQLDQRDLKSGQLYIYNFPGNFGHVKIGITSRTPEERMKEWEKKCGHKPDLIYPLSSDDRRQVAHIYRLEALVHAELREYRRIEIRCGRCKKSHIEWFERPASHVMAVAKKWTAWLSLAPYEKINVEGSFVWKLSKEHTSSAQTLCAITPHPSPNVPSLSPRRSGIRSQSSPGRSRTRSPRSRQISFKPSAHIFRSRSTHDSRPITVHASERKSGDGRMLS